MKEDFDKLSLQLTKTLSLQEKKDQGIYFTPQNAIKALVDKLPIVPKNILEPSCGSGEFLLHMKKRFAKAKITGIENNYTIYQSIKDRYKINNVLHMDYLDYNIAGKHDLIIGNPPYFMTKQSYDDDEGLLYGRNNIYILFLIHSMKLVKKDGVIAFIIPTNFMNSSYYNKIREEIYKNWKIVSFVKYAEDIFLETKQDVFGLIIQKIQDNGNENVEVNVKMIVHNEPYVFSVKGNYYFVFDKRKLPKRKNYKTLSDYGYQVKVGNIQWDANKGLFVNKNKSKNVLIYSTDIQGDGKVTLNNREYRYLHKSIPMMKEKVVVINRGYGNAKYRMNVGIVDGTFPYRLENHVLYISKKDGELTDDEVDNIVKSLQSEKTRKFIEIVLNNNAITANELENVVPIYSV